MTFALVGALALLGGIVQSVAGFGCGIVMMLGFPYLFGLTTGAGISSACSMFLNFSLTWRYRKIVRWKSLIFPLIVYLPCATLLISVSTKLPQKLIKICFGIFLIAISIYYLTAKLRKKNAGLTLWAKILFMILSGVCSGLFGIGGPFAILYFMTVSDEPKVYVGTAQAFFAVTSLYNLIMRIINGIIGVQQIPFIAVGGLLIFIGGVIGSKIMDKIDREKLKLITYIMVGIAGITNFF